MGKVVKFDNIEIDLLKYFGCVKASKVMRDLTQILELDMDLTKYGYKRYMNDKMEKPDLSNISLRKNLELYKRALVMTKKEIEGENILTLKYSSEDGKTGYVSSSDNKKSIYFYLEDCDKRPLLSARIHEYVDGSGQDMHLRYTGNVSFDENGAIVFPEDGSLYEFYINLSANGVCTKINMISYDARTIAMESDIGSAADIISDSEMPSINISSNENVTICGTSLNLELTFEPDKIRIMGEQSPINPSGFAR